MKRMCRCSFRVIFAIIMTMRKELVYPECYHCCNIEWYLCVKHLHFLLNTWNRVCLANFIIKSEQNKNIVTSSRTHICMLYVFLQIALLQYFSPHGGQCLLRLWSITAHSNSYNYKHKHSVFIIRKFCAAWDCANARWICPRNHWAQWTSKEQQRTWNVLH